MDSPIRLHWLDPRNPHQPFPPVHLAMRDPNGLLAIGGDLSQTRLLRAYAQGIFPWYNPDEPILWWCPDPRAALEPDGLRVSRSYRKAVQRGDYAITMDRSFAEVVDACAGARPKSRGTWLGADMRRAYRELYAAGHCHSVEAWRGGALIGGLYGVAAGGMFYGESMFSRADNGSKLALYWLCEQLKEWHFELIDCQVGSAHLLSLGAEEIPRDEFLRRTRPAAMAERPPGRWSFTVPAPHSPEHLPSPAP